MSILYIDPFMKEKLEKFRMSMADYFKINPEIWEEIQTESNEKLITDALKFACEYLEEQEKEINQD